MLENIPFKEVGILAFMFGFGHTLLRIAFTEAFIYNYGAPRVGGRWKFLPNKADLFLTFLMWTFGIFFLGFIYFEGESCFGINVLLALFPVVFLAAQLGMDILPYRKVFNMYSSISWSLVVTDAILGSFLLLELYESIEGHGLTIYNISKLILALLAIPLIEFMSFNFWIRLRKA